MRLVAVIAIGTLVLAGCWGTDREPSDRNDANQILGVLEKARTALLNNQPHEVCDLLTDHGRARALGFQVDFAEAGTPRSIEGFTPPADLRSDRRARVVRR
jgi:hypothetical protein